MANLLPAKELSSLSVERHRRLRTAVLVLISGIAAFGTVLLIPSAIALIAAKDSGEERLATTRRLVELQRHASAGADIAATKEKMGVLSKDISRVTPSALIERVVTLIPAGVALHTLSFAHKDGAAALDLSGTAESRSALILFGDQLKGAGLFTDVVIPIESLAQSSDLQFHLALSLLEEGS
jgi:hypothetical protein